MKKIVGEDSYVIALIELLWDSKTKIQAKIYQSAVGVSWDRSFYYFAHFWSSVVFQSTQSVDGLIF